MSELEPAALPRAEIRSRGRWSIVWLVPLVAALIGGWLAYRTISQQGPSITITFKTAEGIVAGKTEIKYRAIEAGTVTSVKLSEDLSHVIVEATMVKEVENHLNTGARFWVVEPQIGFEGVTGLNTLVSGDYIAFEPGTGESASHFKGLNRPPVEVDLKAGTKFLLRADDLNSVSKGAPIYYRGVTVGKILDTSLAEDAASVHVEIFVKKPRDQLVHQNTLFWNVSGVKLNLGDLLDASVQIASLQSLVAGGIAFANPPNPGAQAKPGATFQLANKRPDAELEENPYKNGLLLRLKAELLGSIKKGDPVLYREFTVGQVLGVALSDNAATVGVDVVINPEYAPLIRTNTVFWNASGVHASFGLFKGFSLDVESLHSLIAGGIAFATPDQGGAAVKDGATFLLYDKPKEEWRAWAPHIRLPDDRPEAYGDRPKETATATSGAQEATPESADGTTTEPEAPEAPLGPPMPKAVTLPVAGDRVSSSMMSEHLEALGFTNITDVQKEGAIFHVKAAWQAEPVRLRIDARDGAITRVGG